MNTYLGICVCGKRMYGTKRRAKDVAKDRFPGEHLVAYRCDRPPHLWHIGHLDREVIAGVKDRSVYEKETE